MSDQTDWSRASGSEPKPDWTIMLYLSGDNNLSSEMERAIKTIGAAGVPEEVAITIQYDPLSPGSPTILYALPPNTQPVIEPHGAAIPLAGAVVGHRAENSADPEVLARFIVESIERFPSSKHRMLILSGHGSGAVGDFLPDGNAVGGQPASLTIPRLSKAFEIASKKLPSRGDGAKLVDVLGMDSCLMSMVEVGYQVRGFAHFLVGSEGFVPDAGWPYGHFLNRLSQRSHRKEPLDPKSICSYIVEDYLEFNAVHLGASLSVEIAACELDRLDDLTEAIWTLTNMLVPKNGGRGLLAERQVQNMLILAHWRAQSFMFEQHTDLWDFCDQLRIESENSSPDLAAACKSVTAAIDGTLGKPEKIRQGFVGVETQHAHGLSVYFPWQLSPLAQAYFLAEYSKLYFSESRWDAFLREYLNATMREERQPEGRPRVVVPPTRKLPRVAVEAAARAPFPNIVPSFRLAPDINKFAPDLNRLAPDFNKFLGQLAGGTLPWSMKNPPQRVLLRGTAAPPPPQPPVPSPTTTEVPVPTTGQVRSSQR